MRCEHEWYCHWCGVSFVPGVTGEHEWTCRICGDPGYAMSEEEVVAR